MRSTWGPKVSAPIYFLLILLISRITKKHLLTFRNDSRFSLHVFFLQRSSSSCGRLSKGSLSDRRCPRGSAMKASTLCWRRAGTRTPTSDRRLRPYGDSWGTPAQTGQASAVFSVSSPRSNMLQNAARKVIVLRVSYLGPQVQYVIRLHFNYRRILWHIFLNVLH